jgi:tetratricopeptide (TPR) repeat protein
MLGEAGKQAWVVEYLTKQSEGNVFFLVEIARVLAEQASQFDGAGLTALPEQIFTLGIGRIVERRLLHVPEPYRPVLEAAATMGRKIDQVVLHHLFPDSDLREFLMICANAAILDSEEGDWRFSHDKLREGLLDRLPAEHRRRLHSDVAGALEANYANVESVSALLAYHFKLAGNPEKASQYFLRAGDSAMRLCAYNDARKHFTGAIAALYALPEDDNVKRQKVDTLVKQVRASHIADQPKQNLARLEEATLLLGSLGGEKDMVADVLRRAWVYYWRGRIHYYCGESRESLEYHQQVLSVAKEHRHTELLMLASAASGTTLFSQGRVDLALPLVLSTIETFGNMGQGYEWVRGVGHQGLCLMGLGQYERGLNELNRAHARALEIDKPMIISMTHLYYCMGSMHSGDYPTMLVRGNKSFEAAKQCGEMIYQSLSLGYIALAENQLGRYSDALAHYQNVRQNIEAMGGKLVLSIIYDAVHADILLNTGHLDEAIERAQTVVSESKAAENCNSWGMAERTWGLALHRCGSTSAAEVDSHMEASIKAFSMGSLVFDIARTRLCWAQICHDRGELVRAQQLLEQGTLPILAAGASYGLSSAQQIARSWEQSADLESPGTTENRGPHSLPKAAEE